VWLAGLPVPCLVQWEAASDVLFVLAFAGLILDGWGGCCPGRLCGFGCRPARWLGSPAGSAICSCCGVSSVRG
jgi:hypothetical protein